MAQLTAEEAAFQEGFVGKTGEVRGFEGPLDPRWDQGPLGLCCSAREHYDGVILEAAGIPTRPGPHQPHIHGTSLGGSLFV